VAPGSSELGGDQDQALLEALTRQLQATQRDAGSPARFEQAATAVLERLGLIATRVGSGELLVSAPTDSDVVTFLVMTLTAATGRLDRQAIPWQHLLHRREELAARFSVVVGESFERGLREWAAAERHVRLVESRQLASVMRSAGGAPLTSDALWESFSPNPAEAHAADAERRGRMEEMRREQALAEAEADRADVLPQLPTGDADAVAPRPPARRRPARSPPAPAEPPAPAPPPTRRGPPQEQAAPPRKRRRRRFAWLWLLALILLLLLLLLLSRCFQDAGTATPHATPTPAAGAAPAAVVSEPPTSPPGSGAPASAPPWTPAPGAAAGAAPATTAASGDGTGSGAAPATPTPAGAGSGRRCAVELIVPPLTPQQQFVVRFAQRQQADVVLLWSEKDGEVELYGGNAAAPLKIAASADSAGAPEAVVLAGAAPGEYVARLRSRAANASEPTRVGLFYDEMSTCEVVASSDLETQRAPAAVTPSPSGTRSPAPTPSGREAVVLIVDQSNSMYEDLNGRQKLTQERAALRSLIAELPDKLPLGMRFFGHRAANADVDATCADVELVHAVGPPDKVKLRRLIDSGVPRGRTPLARSLREAKSDFSPTLTGGTVVLLTDGEETCGGDPVAAAADLRNGRPPVTVHVLGLTDDDALGRTLSTISDAGGGGYRAASDARSLRAGLDEIMASVR
jgi:hypothetical protein